MKLAKSSMYAINWLYSNGKDLEEIADELSLSKETVAKYVEKNNLQNTVKLPVKSSPVKNKKSSQDLMIRHTSNKKNNSVSIMTQAASEVNDSLRAKLNSSKSRNKDHIFNPNDK